MKALMDIDLSPVQKEILDEIEEIFSAGRYVTKEEVIYSAVLFRKVLEISHREKDLLFRTLVFYIDWCLHATLNRKDKFFAMLKNEVDSEFLKRNEIRLKKGLGMLSEESKKGIWSEKISQIVLFEEFKKSLSMFAEEYSIDVSILNDRKELKIFRREILKVIANVPLIVNDKGCILDKILVHSDKNKTKFKQGENLAEHVSDYVIIFKGGEIMNTSLLDGTQE